MSFKLLYFITNIFFVVTLIFALFIHRAVNEEKNKNPDDMTRLKRLKLVRLCLVISTIAFFIAMCANFLADMNANG